jgi:pyrimidine operon attenuation protein/uracil phosphoribosyltransferase
MKTNICSIKVNAAVPTAEAPILDLPQTELKNKVVIITDDVCNTGRTIFFAFKPFMEFVPKKIEVAVLVERMHKCFPVNVDYLGLKLATTTKEDIDVQLENKLAWEVRLN